MSPENEKSRPRHARDREVERFRVALTRKPVDRGAAGIPEAEQLRDLVEGLAGSVVASRAHDPEAGGPVTNVEQQRVPAAREQAQERRVERRGPEIERRDVAVEVVDRNERQAGTPGDALGGGKADQEGADQAGSARDPHVLDLAEPERRRGRAPRVRPARRAPGAAAMRPPGRHRRSGRAAPTAKRRRSTGSRRPP